MTNTPDLTKLNFSDIKTSLTDYLKNQTVFSGYNFEGSTIQTLIDLLSYNTYYYAFYSNMMSSEVFLDSAQNINSIVSLVKPLGYTVPGLKSATSTITVGETVNEYTKFSGVLSNGTYYSFYNQKEFTGDGIITEGKLTLKKDITDTIDYTNFTYMLDETDVDISTIRIYVSDAEWTNTNRSLYKGSGQVFYIERDGNIFTVKFSEMLTTTPSSVSITYLISSGIDANGISSFSTPLHTITDKTVSSGGNDGPDINLIKFAAPKIFSSQDRAVTKNDYYGLLIENSMFDDNNAFVIYGGEELYPPKYGRVFVSYDAVADEAPSIEETISFLRSKNTLTIIPEYTVPKKINIKIEIKIIWKPAITPQQQNEIKTGIKGLFDTYIAGSDGDASNFMFNNQFQFSGFKELVMAKYSDNISNFIFTETLFTTTIDKSSNINEFSLENNITLLDPAAYTAIITDGNNTIRIGGYSAGIVPNGIVPLSTTILGGVDPGVVNMDTGYFRINSVYAPDSVNVSIPTVNTFVSKIKYSLSAFQLQLTQ